MGWVKWRRSAVGAMQRQDNRPQGMGCTGDPRFAIGADNVVDMMGIYVVIIPVMTKIGMGNMDGLRTTMGTGSSSTSASARRRWSSFPAMTFMK